MAVQKKAAAENEKSIDEAMSIVEGLEQASDAVASAEPKDIEDFHASDDDESMEETLASLKEEVSETGAFAQDEVETAEVTDQQENGELTLSLTGNMTLRLRYQYEGQDVIIGFKDHALQVRMSDGTEFKVPVRGRGTGKLKIA